MYTLLQKVPIGYELLTGIFVRYDVLRKLRPWSTANFVLSGNSKVVLCSRLQLRQCTGCYMPVIACRAVLSAVDTRDAVTDDVSRNCLTTIFRRRPL